MKKFLNRITPKTTLNKVNLALTCVFCVMLAGMIYMKSVDVAYGDPGCPEGPFPDCTSGVSFFPHPTDCHWFFHCQNGVAYCHKCPADLHWNVTLDTCDFPHQAGCNKKGYNEITTAQQHYKNGQLLRTDVITDCKPNGPVMDCKPGVETIYY
ncbi:MAG: chitin binding domain-containing protein [Rikenellaceae bacterium]|nr:chitin binding domain-containing protein [Rikenellaceae bacterium]